MSGTIRLEYVEKDVFNIIHSHSGTDVVAGTLWREPNDRWWRFIITGNDVRVMPRGYETVKRAVHWAALHVYKVFRLERLPSVDSSVKRRIDRRGGHEKPR